MCLLLVFLTYVYHDARFRECNSSLLGLCLPLGLHSRFLTFSVRLRWRTVPASSLYNCSHILLLSSKIIIEKPSYISLVYTYHEWLTRIVQLYWNTKHSLDCNSQSHISDTSLCFLVSDALITYFPHLFIPVSSWSNGCTCGGLVTRPEESYPVSCVWVWSWSPDKEEAFCTRNFPLFHVINKMLRHAS